MLYTTCMVLVDFNSTSKGDIKSAAKFLEMFVSEAEDAGLQDSLADACSAIGTMYNTMVKCLQTMFNFIYLHS